MVPRLYRAKFKRDIFKDLSKLEKSYSKRKKGEEELQIDDLEIMTSGISRATSWRQKGT